MSAWIDNNFPLVFLALLDGSVTAFVLALIALGLSLVFGVMRVVNVAHGEFFMLGAVLAWACFHFTGNMPLLGFLLALSVAPVFVGGLAMLSDRLILHRIQYNPESTIVATIGLLYIIQQLVLTFFGPEARPVEAPIYFRVQFPWFGYSGYKLIVAGLSGVLLLGTWFLMVRSKLGLSTCVRLNRMQKLPELSEFRQSPFTPKSLPSAQDSRRWQAFWWSRSGRQIT